METSCASTGVDSAVAVVRVLLADDHPLFRKALRLTLEAAGQIEIVGEAADGAEAVELSERVQPNVALIDISMPVLDGIEATRLIRSRCPSTVVLALTVHNDTEHLLSMLKAGASGYLTKEMLGDDVAQVVRTAATGNAVLSPDALRQFVSTANVQVVFDLDRESGCAEHLSARERQVLRLVAKGMDNRSIAMQLGVSHRTVGSHLEQVFSKLRVRSRTEATAFALRTGIITIEDVG